ncbi:MAG: D-sedoheptulose-7-phosphate isomerase [bacterium]
MTRDPVEHVLAIFAEHARVTERTVDELPTLVAELADAIWRSLASGGKLVLFGNGGSAADAQHFAAELTGRFTVERQPLAALALTTNTSAVTAIANDFEYADVFARQVTALCREGDIVVGISTSGRAPSVIRGIEAAGPRGASAWLLTGGSGGQLHKTRARSITVPSSETARIQEMHITIIHAVCALIDDRFPGADLGQAFTVETA